MEEVYNASEMEDLDFYDGNPAGERWAPLGANDLDDEATCYIQNNGRWVTLVSYFPGGESMCKASKPTVFCL